MKYRQLGQTGLRVSTLCYGTWQFAAAADVSLSAGTLQEIEQIMNDATPIGGPTPECM